MGSDPFLASLPESGCESGRETGLSWSIEDRDELRQVPDMDNNASLEGK
jgi:hypothetical protein